MPVIEETVFIRRSPAEVFDFMADPANFAVWDSSVIEAEQEGDGLPGIGSRTRGTSKILGRRIQWATEGTEFDPPRRIVNTGVEGPLSSQWAPRGNPWMAGHI
ncbi:SRPBCC family protein [Arthrobacter sp. MDT3-24]